MAYVRGTRQNIYPIGRGVALICNQEKFPGSDLQNRCGTDKDCKNLQLVFESLGYRVVTVQNSRADDFTGNLERAVNIFNDHHPGPFVLAFLTHGNKKGLFFSDGKQIPMATIRRELARYRILDGRAKIIISQACRGNEHLEALEDGSVLMRQDEDFRADGHVDPLSDTIIMFSCIEDRAAYRHPSYGSMFIAVTCHEILLNMAEDENRQMHLSDVSTKVNQRLQCLAPIYLGSRVVASMETTNTLRKSLYLGSKEEDTKYQEAIARVTEAVSRLGRPENQTVSYQEMGEDSTGPGCRCVGDCAPGSSCRCRSAGARCDTQCRHVGAGTTAKCTNSPWSCTCKNGDCGSRQCGCRKRAIPCGGGCHPGSSACVNRESRQTTAASAGRPGPSSRPGPGVVSRRAADDDDSDPGVATATAAARAGCSCRTDCGTNGRCGCAGRGAPCSDSCHGGRGGAACSNQGPTPLPPPGEEKKKSQKAVAWSPTAGAGSGSEKTREDGSSCKCKKGCADNRCGCRGNGLPCGPRCHDGSQCQNDLKFSGTEKGTPKKEEGEAPSSKGGSGETGDSDAESDEESDEGVVCQCKTGCATGRCGCVRNDLYCALECHGGSRCQNEGSDDRVVCQCKTGCATGRCSCVKNDLYCARECHGGSRCQNEEKSRRKGKSPGCHGGVVSDSVNQSPSKASGAGGAGAVKCQCKTGCAAGGRCSCRKADSKCNAKCHPSYDCSN